ncbi:hypothetical protein [Variovorax sp. 22077]|uniref:hypothetical protein n=1 Tax=Variovorax sp. 22077 TaxID=3453867 RepID=UPI003F844DE2
MMWINMSSTLGMRDSSLAWRNDFNARSARDTTSLGIGKQVRFHRALAAASMYTTAADYARFMSELRIRPAKSSGNRG